MLPPVLRVVFPFVTVRGRLRWRRGGGTALHQGGRCVQQNMSETNIHSQKEIDREENNVGVLKFNFNFLMQFDELAILGYI